MKLERNQMPKDKYTHYTFTDHYLFFLAFAVGMVSGLVVGQIVA